MPAFRKMRVQRQLVPSRTSAGLGEQKANQAVRSPLGSLVISSHCQTSVMAIPGKSPVPRKGPAPRRRVPSVLGFRKMRVQAVADSPLGELDSNFWSLIQASSAVLTSDARAGHIRHVCFRRAPRINPARDSAIASGQPYPQRKGRSAPGLTPGAADAHLDHRPGPALLPHRAR